MMKFHKIVLFLNMNCGFLADVQEIFQIWKQSWYFSQKPFSSLWNVFFAKFQGGQNTSGGRPSCSKILSPFSLLVVLSINHIWANVHGKCRSAAASPITKNLCVHLFRPIVVMGNRQLEKALFKSLMLLVFLVLTKLVLLQFALFG